MSDKPNERVTQWPDSTSSNTESSDCSRVFPTLWWTPEMEANRKQSFITILSTRYNEIDHEDFQNIKSSLEKFLWHPLKLNPNNSEYETLKQATIQKIKDFLSSTSQNLEFVSETWKCNDLAHTFTLNFREWDAIQWDKEVFPIFCFSGKLDDKFRPSKTSEAHPTDNNATYLCYRMTDRCFWLWSLPHNHLSEEQWMIILTAISEIIDKIKERYSV